jgi:hypothetical protein
MTWHQWQVEYPMLRKIGLLSARRARKGLIPPGVPVHRIIFMLEKIRRFLAREPVGNGCAKQFPVLLATMPFDWIPCREQPGNNTTASDTSIALFIFATIARMTKKATADVLLRRLNDLPLAT